MKNIVQLESITEKILFIRGKKVMLDSDLATLYGVETKVLNQAVNRNIDRFPIDFMFQLSRVEYISLRSQIVTLKRGQHRKYFPYAFTEQGVAMLSSVLRSDRAIKVNIMIMRTFVKLREIISSNKELAQRIDDMEKKYDDQFVLFFETIKQLMKPLNSKDKKKIGFINRKT